MSAATPLLDSRVQRLLGQLQTKRTTNPPGLDGSLSLSSEENADRLLRELVRWNPPKSNDSPTWKPLELLGVLRDLVEQFVKDFPRGSAGDRSNPQQRLRLVFQVMHRLLGQKSPIAAQLANVALEAEKELSKILEGTVICMLSAKELWQSTSSEIVWIHVEILSVLNDLLGSPIVQNFAKKTLHDMLTLCMTMLPWAASHSSVPVTSSSWKAILNRKRIAIQCLGALFQKNAIKTISPTVSIALETSVKTLRSLLETVEILLQYQPIFLSRGTQEDTGQMLAQLLQSLNISHEPANVPFVPPRDVQTSLRKLSVACLRSLQMILVDNKALITTENVGQLAKIIYNFAYFRNDELDSLVTSGTAKYRFGYSAYMASNAASQQVGSGTSKYLPPHLRADSDSSDAFGKSSFSETDYSDAEGSRESKIRQEDERIRLHAVHLLRVVVKESSKLFYPYWSLFFPDRAFQLVESCQHSSGETKARNIDSLARHASLNGFVLHRTHQKLQQASLHAIAAFFEGNQAYLAVAIESTKKSSFTSLSEKLGSFVAVIHHLLVLSLKTENSCSILQATLDTVHIVVRNSTYEKMAQNLPLEMLTALSEILLRETSGKCVTSIFRTLTALLQVERISKEHKSQLLTAVDDTFVNMLLDRAQPMNTSVSVRVAALETFHACLGQLPSLRSRYDRFEPILSNAFEGLNATHKDSISILESTMLVLDKLMEVQGQAEKQELEWWTTLIDWYLQKAISTTEPAFHVVRSLACDALSRIPGNVFSEIPDRCRVLCVTLTFGLIQDESSGVRASACRTLGVFLLFPLQRLDLLFSMDACTATIPKLKDSNLNVRVRASWALANASDCLEEYQRLEFQEAPGGKTLFDDAFVLRLTRSLLGCAKDSEKLRSNLLRGLGNCLHALSEEVIRRELNASVKEIMDVFARNAETGTVKTRWNACHSIGKAMSVEKLPIGMSHAGGIAAPYTMRIFNALLHCLTKCKNYKVRIHACVALRSPGRRSAYEDESGQVFRLCWETVVEALKERLDAVLVQSIVGEDHEQLSPCAGYEVQLDRELLQTLSHLTRLTIAADLSSLKSLFEKDLEVIRQLLEKYEQDSPPSTATTELSPWKHLEHLWNQGRTLM